MTDAANQPVWQWPYSAFGNNKPTGVLSTITKDEQTRLKATTPASELNLRFPGQYYDAETGFSYNGFRTYDPHVRAGYTQPDPIGLAGGPNKFVYVDGNPLMYTDPLGLWSVEGGVYLGVGASMTLGRDPNSGGRFMTFKFGKGFGWGASYDPQGGRAGSAEDQSCKGGIGLGFYGEGGGHAGPLTGKVEANFGRNFFFGGGSDGYGGIQPKGTLDSTLRGTKAVGAVGVEITIFGPRVSK